MKQFSDHIVDDKPILGGDEKSILHVFDSAMNVLDQERENKIRANELDMKPAYTKDKEQLEFIDIYKNKPEPNIISTIKHILKIEEYLPSKNAISIAEIDYLQHEKDLIVALKDKYQEESSELNLTWWEGARDQIAILNDKIRKLTFVTKAFTSYIREYNDELITILQQKS